MPANLIEWTKDRARQGVRLDEGGPMPVPPVVDVDSAALHVPKAPRKPGEPRRCGRNFASGNKARQVRARKEQLKARSQGISTMNPEKVPEWMRAHVETGAPYNGALLTMLQNRPALFALAGDTADAHVMYRALLSLSLDAEDAKVRTKLLTEARGWLREHRTSLATLSALAGDIKLPPGDAWPGMVDVEDDSEGAK